MRIHILRRLTFAQVTLLAVVGVMAVLHAERNAVRDAADPGQIRLLGWAYAAIAVGGLFVVLRTYWRPERSVWRVVAWYFIVTSLCLLITACWRWLLPDSAFASALRSFPGGGFAVSQFWIGNRALAGVGQRIWEQQRPGFGGVFR